YRRRPWRHQHFRRHRLRPWHNSRRRRDCRPQQRPRPRPPTARSRRHSNRRTPPPRPDQFRHSKNIDHTPPPTPNSPIKYTTCKLRMICSTRNPNLNLNRRFPGLSGANLIRHSNPFFVFFVTFCLIPSFFLSGCSKSSSDSSSPPPGSTSKKLTI